jgi:sulfane dehydrogenase subunit SoxC
MVTDKPELTGENPVNRRNFIKGGAAIAGGLAATVVPTIAMSADLENLPPHVPLWSQGLGDGVDVSPYGTPSEFEKKVIRRTVPWLTATPESSVSFTPLANLHGIITPNGLHFCRHHGGIADINYEDHRLIIHGLIDRELIFTMDDIKRMPSVNRIHFLECAANGAMEWRGAQLEALQFTHGMISCCEWTGVKLSTLLDECGIKPKAKWLLAEGADASGMTRSIPLHKAIEDCIVVYAQNGEMLRPEQGYPLRLLVPGWEGNMSIKWLRRIEVGDQPWHTREETAKYTDLMPTGKARQFTWFQECKSVITSPSVENPINGKGFVEIQGLAWTGHGKIQRVDISSDGGKNWQSAQIDGPILGKALTRFRMPWEWDGKPAFLQSRAIDETGYVQPDFTELRALRGDWSIYHNNSVHTWKINTGGDVENVQLS